MDLSRPASAGAPNASDNIASVTIVCTDDEARAIESWLHQRQADREEYRDAALGIRMALSAKGLLVDGTAESKARDADAWLERQLDALDEGTAQ